MARRPPIIGCDDAALAGRLGLQNPGETCDLLLSRDDLGLALHVLRAPQDDPQLIGGHPLCVDLTTRDTRSGQGRSLKQPLIRAMGVVNGNPWRPRVWDMTAGLGEDAAMLHALGCDVTGIERNGVLHALLEDALHRAALPIACVHADALDVLRKSMDAPDARAPQLTCPPDVIYLDPMFEGHKRKGAEKKAMRVVRWLVSETPATDETALLDAALSVATRRVVVKRPRIAPPLASRAPQAKHEGRAVRYDVYPAG